ncbi:hypothetical protein BLS_006954 [Venturia inaequalis]|uniref:Uncharacterized protein n=1 Tax=Venturia inaequalis TaxID=5025 RepID=A0A8H3UBI8_VENIN|nr:hypothetical protein BLS_006954 [Venturia inaequalis]KAE9969822.1 hypothetical protein EG328_006658 [Venturia inaequalis]KAE9987302.1 hypothetical protein EG327_003878 [Venturia inaequalis]
MSRENVSPNKGPLENASDFPKKPPPPSFSKFFKTTKNARKLMDPQERVCELDINDPNRVMVYATPEVRAMHLNEAMPHNKEGLDEMLWSQPLLYESSQKEPTLRITRKKVQGTYLEILHRDIFNGAEQREFDDKPHMGSSLAHFKLGFIQAHKHKYVYILSRTRAEQRVIQGIGAIDNRVVKKVEPGTPCRSMSG